MKKFFIIYANIFAIIWIGTGLYALISGQPKAFNTFLFGLAFSIVIFLASWFSYWMINRIKQIDAMAREITTKK